MRNAALDVEYQAAVKRNDADAMAKILDERFILVLGSGKTRTVRVFGDTAVVTALLALKGVSEGKPFARRLWFSDTYVRTPGGWRYVFGQASLPLPES
ncbi:MAG TPA: nuclear transport factor 2 family protein [Steroidobacteraceae bacterium]|nr:nuclear transport factor 2 family protein [Steroidobacteraceae bacterium]